MLDVLCRRLLLLLHVPLHVAHLHRVQAVVELHHVDVGLLVALLEVSLSGHHTVVYVALVTPPSLLVVAVTPMVAVAWIVAASVAPPVAAVTAAVASAITVVVVGAAAFVVTVDVAALRCPVKTDILPRLC